MTVQGGGKEGGGDCEPYGVGSRRRNAPLHSPKLTQRRTHPAVIYSTPAGERERPRVRRCHEEKTRGRAHCIPTRGLTKRDDVSNIGRAAVAQPIAFSSSCFRYRDLATSSHRASPTGQIYARSGSESVTRHRRKGAKLQFVRPPSAAAQDLPDGPCVRQSIQSSS